MALNLRLLLVATAVLGSASQAFAQTTFSLSLTNGQESSVVVPTLAAGGPRPASFGTATLVLDASNTALTYDIQVFNIDFTGSQTADLNDNLVAAHIHAGPTIMPSGNLGVVFGFFGAPLNDNAPNNVVVTPFANGVGGTVSGIWNAGEGNNTSLTAQLPNLLAGRAYLNFHTVQFGGGEVRGNFPGVPEPSTWTMMLLGFGMVGGALRAGKRRSKVVDLQA